MLRYTHITSKCFVNGPFDRLMDDLLPLFIENRVQPEIGLEGSVLYTYTEKDFRKIARAFKEAGLQCTIHAPFLDLVPGSLDRQIRRASGEKLKKAFSLIEIFEPVSIVCHLGYEEPKHGFKKDKWFTNALETWEGILETAVKHKTPMMLENTFETNPEMHLRILEALDSEYARFCLDVGHVMAFARNTWQDWLPAMKPYLGQLHLHDNYGMSDDHLALGKGLFDFAGLFDFLKQNELDPVITLEPHHADGLPESLEFIDSLHYFPKEPGIQ
jgi:sugar phosphate isomerase/epimerase